MRPAITQTVRILAIDDDNGSHELYQQTLFGGDSTLEEALNQVTTLTTDTRSTPSSPRYRLDHAMSGSAGYQMAVAALEEDDPYGVIYLDMRMPPGWNGIQTALKIREIDPFIRIILITAYSDLTLVEIRQQIGVDFDLLQKPVNPDELLQLTRMHAHKWCEAIELETARHMLERSHEQLEQQVALRTEQLEKANQRTQKILESMSREKEQIELILESMREGVVVVDRMGNIQQINRKMERLTGKEDLQITGQPLHTLFTQPKDNSETEALQKQQLINAQQQLQLLAEEQQPLLRSWIDSALIATLLIDSNGKILVGSPAVEGISGWRASQLINRSIEVLLPEGSRQRHADLVAQFFKQPTPQKMGAERTFPLLQKNSVERAVEIGLIPLQIDGQSVALALLHDPSEQQQWDLFTISPLGRLFSGTSQGEMTLEWQLLHQDQTTIPMNVTSAPLYREQDELILFNGAVLVLHDLREILTSESQRQARKAKEDFLASMSHELRTPLTNIIGSSEALSSGPLNSEQKILLHSVERSSHGLLALINDILDYSKIKSNSLILHEQSYDLTSIIQQLEARFSEQATEAGLQLKIVNQLAQPPFQIGDAERISQILSNLLSNAVKFSKRGTITLTITTEADNRQLHFTVQDEGIGIPPERVNHLFQPFTQLDNSTSRRFGGVGLGLFISGRLAQLMGGNIQTESREGYGSCFRLSIPNQPATRHNTLAHGNNHTAPQLDGKILLAEDTPEMQLLVSRMLQKLGLEVTIANDGQEAVEQALAHHFDLILMDMQMPVMDGIEATRTLRQLGYLPPIVALTANVMPEHRARFEAAGCDEFLGKPIDRNALNRVLHHYLRSITASSSWTGTAEESLISDDLRELFIERTTNQRKELLIALLNEHWSEIRSIAHNIKGSGTTFGHPELTQLGKEVCDAIDEQRFETVPPLVDSLTTAMSVITTHPPPKPDQ